MLFIKPESDIVVLTILSISLSLVFLRLIVPNGIRLCRGNTLRILIFMAIWLILSIVWFWFGMTIIRIWG